MFSLVSKHKRLPIVLNVVNNMDIVQMIDEASEYLAVDPDLPEEGQSADDHTDDKEKIAEDNENNIDDENDLHEMQVDDDLNEPDAEDAELAKGTDLAKPAINREEDE